MESLDKVDEFLAGVEKEEKEIDGEIAAEIRSQSKIEEDMRKAVKEQNKLVEELVGRISKIKSKGSRFADHDAVAEISENQVKTICSDIKNLDNAKKNLTWTISALKKQMMLITAIEQLRKACIDKCYKEAARLIDATGDLLKTFDEYKGIPQIQQIKRERDNLCTQLRLQIGEELKLYQSHDKRIGLPTRRVWTTHFLRRSWP